MSTILPLVISLGDPAGISAEIILKAAQQRSASSFIVTGSLALLEAERARLGLDVALRPLGASGQKSGLYVLDNGLDHEGLEKGKASALGGASAFASLNKAIDLVFEGRARALVTAPLNKKSLSLAGIKAPGHTEILAERAGGVPVSMAMVNRELKILLVTCHQSLMSVVNSLTPEAFRRAIDHAQSLLKSYGIARPRLAVAGFNPHAGEDGLFGTEDQDLVAPAVREAQAKGLDVSGPHAPDTVFMRARAGDFDLVIALYHDQGLIPIKYLGLDEGVNITVGLPFVRTSPDHGTAYDLVHSTKAKPDSLLAALDAAEALTNY